MAKDACKICSLKLVTNDNTSVLNPLQFNVVWSYYQQNYQ